MPSTQPSQPSVQRAVRPTDPQAEAELGRVALWLDPADLAWLAQHCCCPEDATEEHTQRCARIRFRAGAALHKSGEKQSRRGGVGP